MGEGSRKHAKVLQRCQRCIYCGGLNLASTIDHMPPRVFFRLSQRPKGLEFPACIDCNRGTSKADLVAAFFARSFPGISNQAEALEWEQLPTPCVARGSLNRCRYGTDRPRAPEQGRTDRVGAATAAARQDVSDVVEAAVDRSQGSARAVAPWRREARP